MGIKMCLFVVYDRIAEESGPVFEAVNTGVAIRNYRAILSRANNYPEEYQLLQVGTYDHTINQGVIFEKPECVCWGLPEGDKLSNVYDVKKEIQA